jgi:hypothetical protein
VNAEVSVQQRIERGCLRAARRQAHLSKLVRLSGLAIALLFLAAPCLAQDQGDQESSTQSKDVANEPLDEETSTQSGGWSVNRWYIFTSIYTVHTDPEPDHVNNQKMLGLEMQMTNNWLFGFASFDNSFGQRSEYLYAGYMWPLFSSDHWYFKLTGGLLYGYKEPYEDKIPLNGLGVAPVILPVLGFRYKWFTTEVSFAGTAAINLSAGITF